MCLARLAWRFKYRLIYGPLIIAYKRIRRLNTIRSPSTNRPSSNSPAIHLAYFRLHKYKKRASHISDTLNVSVFENVSRKDTGKQEYIMYNTKRSH